MKGEKVFTKQEAEEIISLIKQKLMSEPTKQKGIRNKIRKLVFFASDFGLHGGYTVNDFLGVVKIAGGESRHSKIVTSSNMNVTIQKPIVTKSYRHNNRDEDYIIDLL